MTNWKRPSGESYVKNYAEMLEGAHLLIGGETGSGKSTVLNGIMLTAISTMTPDEVQFVLIDPKRVELSQYKTLPHTCKFVPSAKDADETLKDIIEYMDNTYEEMEAQGIRKSNSTRMYIVIDEMASLLLTPYAKTIKESLQDILQRGRAANIHVIACTQSPSRKTIPAELVLNFTHRVALHCASAIESKQILNEAGAENLNEYGEVLYKSPMKGIKTIRKLPCYSDEEIARRVKFWADQKPVEREKVMPTPSVGFKPSAKPVRTKSDIEVIGSAIASILVSCIMIAVSMVVLPIKGAIWAATRRL